MMTASSKEQICLRITPPAYKDLTEITMQFKNMGIRGWTNSAVINLMIREARERYLKLSAKELEGLFEKYNALRGKITKE